MIAYILANRWAQFALAGAAGVIAFLIWLAVHDSGVRKATTERIEQKAQEQSIEAANRADEAALGRNEAYHETRIDNASSVSDYLEQLRERQCKADPARCR